MAEAALVTLGLPQDGDPFEILIAEIARTNGHVLWLAGIVAKLDEEDVTWGLTESEIQQGADPKTDSYIRTKHGSGVNVWIQLYQAERTHLVRVCKEAIALGLAERQVELAEQMGKIVADVLRATVADPELDLTPTQQGVALRVVSKHLRALPPAA